jgi:GT2 family glycosyltransferase
MVTDQYFLSMFRLSQVLIQHGIRFRITTLRNESLVTRARNILTAMFLEDTSCTHLMFIDADIEFDPDGVIRMLAMDKDIIAAAYPKKTINWDQVKRAVEQGKDNISTYGADYAINLKVQPGTRRVRTHMGAVEVLDASTGFFIVKREVIERMVREHPELHYKNDSSIDPKFNPHCYALWDTEIDPTDRRYLSEDYAFCRRWQRMGGEIWVDPNTKLNHVGSFTFEGQLTNLLQREP